jgi:hypothetical protein
MGWQLRLTDIVIEFQGQWKPPINDSQIEIVIELEPECRLGVRFGLYRHRTGTSGPEGKADLNGGKADIRGTTQSEAVSLKGGVEYRFPGRPLPPFTCHTTAVPVASWLTFTVETEIRFVRQWRIGSQPR